MNKFIIQKSGSAIPGGTALLYRVFTRSAIAFHPGNAHQDDQKYQYQQGNADNANQAGNNNGRHNNGAQSDAVEAGGLRGAGGSGLCAHGRSGGVILICISKTEHSIKSFHVSLMFDGLILASKTPEVNTAYYPKKKGENGDKYPILTIWTTFAPRAREESSPRGLFLFAPVGHRGGAARQRCFWPHTVWGRGTKGGILFPKRIPPLNPPEKGEGSPPRPPTLAVCSSNNCTRCAVWVRCTWLRHESSANRYVLHSRLTIVRRE